MLYMGNQPEMSSTYGIQNPTKTTEEILPLFAERHSPDHGIIIMLNP